jgi:multicomponent Na+:H+ antiporter subunit G
MTDWIIGVLFLSGAFFVFVAGLGVLRLPDVFTRMHASTKAGTLGSAFILAGAAVHFGTLPIAAKVILTILFLLLTAPIASHMIGRAAQRTGVPMWTGARYEAPERRPGDPGGAG